MQGSRERHIKSAGETQLCEGAATSQSTRDGNGAPAANDVGGSDEGLARLCASVLSRERAMTTNLAALRMTGRVDRLAPRTAVPERYLHAGEGSARRSEVVASLHAA